MQNRSANALDQRRNDDTTGLLESWKVAAQARGGHGGSEENGRGPRTEHKVHARRRVDLRVGPGRDEALDSGDGRHPGDRRGRRLAGERALVAGRLRKARIALLRDRIRRVRKGMPQGQLLAGREAEREKEPEEKAQRGPHRT
jgi:hypothetical protein